MEASQIIATLYQDNQFDSCIRKFTDADHFDDFKQDLFCVLLKKDKDLIKSLHHKNELIYYAVAVMRLMKFEVIRGRKHTELNESIQSIPAEDYQEINISEFIANFNSLDTEFGTFYHREIIKLIAKYGSQNEVSRRTGINKTNIVRTVAMVRQHLKSKLC